MLACFDKVGIVKNSMSHKQTLGFFSMTRVVDILLGCFGSQQEWTNNFHNETIWNHAFTLYLFCLLLCWHYLIGLGWVQPVQLEIVADVRELSKQLLKRWWFKVVVHLCSASFSRGLGIVVNKIDPQKHPAIHTDHEKWIPTRWESMWSPGWNPIQYSKRIHKATPEVLYPQSKNC